MNSNHDLIILGVILVIVLIQLLVFISVFRKIRINNSIFSDNAKFVTTKVKIPESLIEKIAPDEALHYKDEETGKVNFPDQSHNSENNQSRDQSYGINNQADNVIEDNEDEPVLFEDDNDPEVFYFDYPDANGSFDENNAHMSFKANTSLFKCNKTGQTLATFSYVGNKKVTNYFLKKLSPACEVFKDGVLSLEPNLQLKNISDGQLIRTRSAWHIVTKLKLELSATES